TSQKKEDLESVAKSEKQPSLFDHLEKWLERTPFLSSESFDFWQNYRVAVEKRMNKSRENLKGLDEEIRQKHLAAIDSMEKSFHSIFDEKEYQKMQKEGHWRLSHKALCAALFIYLYRDEPILQLPFNLMTS